MLSTNHRREFGGASDIAFVYIQNSLVIPRGKSGKFDWDMVGITHRKSSGTVRQIASLRVWLWSTFGVSPVTSESEPEVSR
jgi:hypothetical protein